MAVARASVTDIDLKTWPSVRPGSLATYSGRVRHVRWLLTWQCREPATSRARVALFYLSTATGSTFVFRLPGPSKVISPSSRFKISSDSYIGIDSLFRCLVLRAFWSLASAIWSPRAWVTGRRNWQCCRSPISSDFDDMCHCEGKCAERGKSSRNGCRRSCQHRLCCCIRTVRDKDLKSQETQLW